MAPRWVVASAVGLAQMLAFGTSLYLLSVLSRPIHEDTGWPLSLVVGGMSGGLLAGVVIGPAIGRWIKRRGGRPALMLSSVLFASGLASMALAPSLPVYFFAWSLMGCGMASGLYDVAFGALGRVYGLEARRAITVVTLWGGFASTVFWALSGVLVTSIGWRGTCAVFALMHLAIALPIYRWVLPPAAPLKLEEGASPPDVTISPLARQAVALFGVVLMAETLVASIVSVHLINILQDRGLQLAAAVGLAAFIGPAQVSARFGESLMGVRHHPSLTMIVAVGGMALGVALVALLPSSAAVAALVIYGIGLGLVSVARGALPLYLFGPLEAPVVTGRLARPIALVQAIAPSAGAVLLTRVGAEATLWVLAIVGGVSLVAAVWLRSLSRRMAGEAGG